MAVTGMDRRDILKAMMAAGGAASGLIPSIARALEIPANRRTGTIEDVEHVVILTQENRAFDHYFGTLNGVHGFGDRFVLPARDADGKATRSVFLQPSEKAGAAPAVAPFHLDTRKDFRLVRFEGTPHLLPDAQAAWNEGRLDAWPLAKHNHSMGYFTRADIPFQYALAEAFTLCDAYHCSFHGGTNPNRLFIWTGTNDPAGRGHGPAIDNSYDNLSSDPFGHGGYTWTTYPERLQDAGISFQIYQDMEDNFDDNPLEGFQVYRKAKATGSGRFADLAQRTIATRKLDLLKADVEADRLPQVSWIVAPAAYSEHPMPSSPLQGAEFTARLLDALTANPDVWAKTALIINFDENDGLFDHVPPPCPPSRDPADPARLLGQSTVPLDGNYHVHVQDDADRPYLNHPYGLGPRVPMFVVSPWSRGGYVASEVFDHTSVIRFLETRFGVHEPNISAWRRAVCGDLTSCFDFSQSDDRPFVRQLPPMEGLSQRAAALSRTLPETPAHPDAPVQESGLRRRRATPYRLEADLTAQTVGTMRLRLANLGKERAAVFHVYDIRNLAGTPQRHTVGAGMTVLAGVPVQADGQYDLFLLGPNGFHRRFTGTGLAVTARLDDAEGKSALVLTAPSGAGRGYTVRDMAYGQNPRTVAVAGGDTARLPLDLEASHGWYDLQVESDQGTVRLAGHVETGMPSYSDPAAGGAAMLTLAG